MLPKVQAGLHVIGAVLFPIGIGLVVSRGTDFELFTILGSLVVFSAMALFAVIVFRSMGA